MTQCIPKLGGQPVDERHDDLPQAALWRLGGARPRGAYLGEALQLGGALARARIEQDGEVFARLLLGKPVGALEQPDVAMRGDDGAMSTCAPEKHVVGIDRVGFGEEERGIGAVVGEHLFEERQHVLHGVLLGDVFQHA